MTAGLLLALVLVFVPFIPAQEPRIVGAVLFGFAVGWALVAQLSARRTDQPQRWALLPAAFMGVSGLLLLAFGPSINGVLNWVWPPLLLAVVISSWVGARRQLHSRSKALLAYPLLALLGLWSVGGGYETVREALDASAYPMPGKLVDVGGHRLHLSCTGTGSPTVLLQPGGGDMSSTMAWIAPKVAATSRVCVYDRPGRGRSDPVDVLQDGNTIATDLHSALQKANVPGPYVVAGHSFGGLYTLAFAAKYPNEVSGMVLIDSTMPDATSGASVTASSDGVLARGSALLSSTARVGLARLYTAVAGLTLPPRATGEAKASMSTVNGFRSTLDEYAAAGAAVRDAAALTTFGSKPLVVLTAGDNPATWFPKQNQLATLSTNARHEVFKGVAHEDMVASQQPASRTAQAITEVVAAVRAKAPLTP
ncbi:alpha/beta fold hydrolase [Phycicoccus ginsengisoli]